MKPPTDGLFMFDLIANVLIPGAMEDRRTPEQKRLDEIRRRKQEKWEILATLFGVAVILALLAMTIVGVCVTMRQLLP